MLSAWKKTVFGFECGSFAGELHWYHKLTYQKAINPHIVLSHAIDKDVVLYRMHFDSYSMVESEQDFKSL